MWVNWNSNGGKSQAGFFMYDHRYRFFSETVIDVTCRWRAPYNSPRIDADTEATNNTTTTTMTTHYITYQYIPTCTNTHSADTATFTIVIFFAGRSTSGASRGSYGVRWKRLFFTTREQCGQSSSGCVVVTAKRAVWNFRGKERRGSLLAEA